MSETKTAVKAYTVHAAGTANCPCGAGETWDIVLHQGTPDELALSTSYDSREHAEDLAEELNYAYDRGMQAGIRP
jgi:hypothetical protein